MHIWPAVCPKYLRIWRTILIERGIYPRVEGHISSHSNVKSFGCYRDFANLFYQYNTLFPLTPKQVTFQSVTSWEKIFLKQLVNFEGHSSLTESLCHCSPTYIGEDAEFRFTVEGFPVPTITWNKGWKSITPTPERYTVRVDVETKEHIFIIHTCKMTDIGKYTCKLTNSFGEEKCIAQLTVKEKPKEQPAPLQKKLKKWVM